MSILNLKQSQKNNMMDPKKETERNTDELMGVHGAIRNFVEAKKAMASPEDKGKKGVVAALKKNKSKE